MKILYAASEVLPFSSSGGLADVMGSLPEAVKSLSPDADVRVISPLYASVKEKYGDRLVKLAQFTVRLSWRNQYCAIYGTEKNGVTYYFVDNEYYFKRGSLYGDFDDGERFAYFSAAVLDAMAQLNFYPDVLHANDWQTALAVVQLKTRRAATEGYRDVRAVFSIHNILFQGIYDFAIAGDVFDLSPEGCRCTEFNGKINLMKGAVVCADRVVTVSPRYAQEIKTPEYAQGLDPIIRMYEGKLHGILNGIDVSYYDPHTDPALYRNYTWRSLRRKTENKTALQRDLSLPEAQNVPLISVISRLTEQKGLSLIEEQAEALLNEDVQLVILGCGDPRYEEFFRRLEAAHPDKVRTLLLYDKDLSKRIYAASDLFLMPSRTEPCGLSQMIASRYGAVPVVRETGGLYDSIHPYRIIDGKPDGNGFTFAPFNGADLLYVVRQALALYRDRAAFDALAVTAMRTDFSWRRSAADYLQLYQTL